MTLVIAHRGASLEAPENSIEALDLGMSLGADAIEVDVRQAGDGRLLVIHDATLDRTTDGSGVIAGLTGDVVSKARLANGEAIPELRDVLARYPGIEITVDVKDAAAAGAVVSVINDLDRVDETILYVEDGVETSAFAGYEGRRATSTAQALRLVTDPRWITSAPSREIPEVVHTPMAWDETGIVTHELVRRVRDSGRTIQVWTIDDPNTADLLVRWGADGIITNDVRGLRARFGSGPWETETT